MTNDAETPLYDTVLRAKCRVLKKVLAAKVNKEIANNQEETRLAKAVQSNVVRENAVIS